MTTNTNAATWTDKQYLEQLALHYQNNPVPEIRAHHERLMKIASTLSTAAAQPPETCDALGKRLIGEMLEADAIATVVCRQVAELPDRSSPEDWPEAMLVTHEELDSIVFEAVNAAQSSPQPAQAWPIAPDVAADLERSDWTPEEALRWYAAGKHYDTVPNGDGTSSARILDTGEVASNALRAYEQPPSTGVEPGRLLAEHVLGMDFVTDRGLRARELARKVLAQHCTAAPQPAVQQVDASPTMPKDIEMMATNRYRPVPSGVLAYKVVGGDGNRSLFSGSKDECQIVARKLTEAFLDGAYVALSTHPAAPVAQGDAWRDLLWQIADALECTPCTADEVLPKVLTIAEEAARYRWLRDETLVDGEINDEIYVHVDSPDFPNVWALTGSDLDAAIDAARSPQEGSAA